MATQEPNVYAGLSVVIGGLMHARPKFFAKVMGELLFWVGEDKMTFGSDYGIWEPKWQVEGFVDWQMPDDDELSDYAKLTTATKKKILGLNAAKLYDIKVPAEFLVPAQAGEPGREGRRGAGHRGMSSVTDAPAASISAVGLAGAVLRGPGDGARSGARRAHHHPGVRLVLHRLGGGAGAGPAAPADVLLRPQLRLPDGGRRLRRGRRGAGRGRGRGDPRRPLRVGRDQRRRGRAGRVRRPRSTARRSTSSTSSAPRSCARRCWPAPTWSAARSSPAAAPRPSWPR